MTSQSKRLFTQGMVLKGGTAMSKVKKGNVVGAHENGLKKFGADTGRLYNALFAAPPEKKDLEWNEESIEGAWRFLNRVFRLVDKHAGAVRGAAQFEPPPRRIQSPKRNVNY